MNQKDKAANRRLLRTYGITLADYDYMFDKQGGICKICHKPPKEGRRLHIDHDHASHKVKIKPECIGYENWKADVSFNNKGYVVLGKSSKQVKQTALIWVRQQSVRGLVCWRCNTSLQKFNDDPTLMESAAKYIRDYKEKK